MGADTILVIDAGTSALRAVAVSSDGRTATVAREPWHTRTPEDAAPFGREFDPDEVRAALDRLVEAGSVLRSPIAGVAFTGQREGLVFAGEDGDAVLISPNVDARASAEGMAIDGTDAVAVYAETGHLPSLMQAPAKFAWLERHRPMDAARVRYAVPLADWLASRLTGTIVASRSLLAENGMLDIRSLQQARREPLPAHLIPSHVAEGACASRVRNGRLAGCHVVICGGDTQCALVGAGAVDAGQVAVSAGWSAPLQLVTSSPMFDDAMRTWAGLHVVPGRWVVESNGGEAGRVWDWLVSMLDVPVEDADQLSAASPVGARDVMAVLGAPRMNAAAMNAGVGGLTLPLPLVMSSPERSDLLRSVLEATAFTVRANLEQAEEVARMPVHELRLAGGMSRSGPFARILADVIDRPLHVAGTPETSALGAAVLAAPALGVHPSLSAAVDAMVRPSAVVLPESRASVQYEDLYQRWLAMCDAFSSMP